LLIILSIFKALSADQRSAALDVIQWNAALANDETSRLACQLLERNGGAA
jgi:hypothetical protein